MDVQTDGTTLHVAGTPRQTGKNVLLLHGWATTSAVWAPTRDRWDREGLLALDFRGVGYSDKPDTGYTIERFAADVVDVIDAIGAPVQLVGHSMGGLVAQRVAIDHPDKLDRVVLVSPVPATGVPLPEEDRAFFRSLAGRAEGMQTVLSSMMAGGTCEGFDQLHAASASVHPACYLESLDAWSGASFADELGRIDLPVHVLSGGAETVLTPDLVREHVAERIPGASFAVLDGVGHYPQWEAPDRFVTALRERLQA